MTLSVMVLGFKGQGHKVELQKYIEGDRVAGVSYALCLVD